VEISYEEVGQILRLIEELDCETVSLEVGDVKIHVSRSGSTVGPPAATEPAVQPSPPAPVQPAPNAEAPGNGSGAAEAAPPAGAAATTEEDAPPGCVPVTAPMVGTFYRRPAPDEPPFTEVGGAVKASDQVGILEVMKLMNELTAGVDGRVVRIDAENSEVVDYGRVLMWIEPEA
jgi:acetyl-CoA carboxylase biotin carboxyl carrier protein